MTKEEILGFVGKNPIGIGCGVLALLLAGGSYWRSDEVPDSEEELTKKSAEAERYAANLKNAAQLKEQYDALVAANKSIDARVIRAGQLGKNLQYFYKLENETGVKLTADPRQGVPATKKDAKAAYIAVPYQLSVQGDLTQLLSFLRRLENGTHFCRVLNITLTGGGDRSAPLALMVNLELLGLP